MDPERKSRDYAPTEPPIKNCREETKVAVDAALEAGKVVLDVYNTNFSVLHKNDKEPLTEADLKSQDILLQALSINGFPILSEEARDDKQRLSHSVMWIIDPLDGTSDFINRTGEFSVMISLVENRIPIMGVVYQPVNGNLYVAERGKGAYANVGGEWKRLTASITSHLPDCRAVVSRHHLAENEMDFLKQLRLSKFSQRGSCGLKIAEICSRKAELYFTTTDKIKHWDSAAAHCLITEAGGRITDMFGNILEYNTDIVNHEKGLLVTNGMIHSDVVARYKHFLLNGKE